MLKPFQIRDLHVFPAEENLYDSSTDSVISSPHVDDTRHRRHGIITLSAPEYDEIASNHPNALLTYMDDDDGDMITVGSSFELGQRLDEPINPEASPQDNAHRMHLFDIRRSRSVTELWKAVERKSASLQQFPGESSNLASSCSTVTADTNHNIKSEIHESVYFPSRSREQWINTDESPKLPPNLQDDKVPETNSSSHKEPLHDTTNPNEINTSPFYYRVEPEPLLSAFEAEIAKILEEQAAQPKDEEAIPTSSTPADASQPDSVHSTWPRELVANILQGVVGGMESLGNELKAKIPELERRLMEAQKVIPDDFNAKAWTALTSVESQIKNLAQIIQNASDASGQAAERVRQAELRSAEQVIDGLGGMAQGFEDFGKSLYAAFEAEFGRRDTSTQTETTNDASSSQNKNCKQATDVGKGASDSALDASKDADPGSEASTFQDSRHESTGAFANSLDPLQGSVAPNPTTASRPPSKPVSIDQTAAPKASPAHYHVPGEYRFSNWPNRSAFVPSAPPVAPPPPVALDTVTGEKTQPAGTSSSKAPKDNTEELAAEVANVQHLGAATDSLFIGNIGYQVTERVIEEVFASKGFFAEIQLPKDSFTGKHVGFGYARFQSTQSAKTALEKLQGIIIDGHSINLEFSDNSPIDTLQVQPSVNNRTRPTFPDATAGQRLRHRQSWHPSTHRHREQRSMVTSSRDDLPKIFSGNSRGTSLRNRRPDANPTRSLVERNVSLNHPEESPEFAARYPSLLPSRSREELPPSVPKRSMTFSPSTEMARFPPVSQLDAHLLANQYRSENRNNNTQGPSSSVAASAVPTAENVGPVEQSVFQQPIQYQSSSLTPSLASSHGAFRGVNRGRVPERTPTEPRSLHHRAHEASSTTRHPSFHETSHALPGSFPVDNNSEPVTQDNNDTSERDMQTALRQSVIDNCVDNLTMLGYGAGIDSGRQRLSIYAEAVDGKLTEAIDMIEEERRVYERNGSFA